ncbi:MULTISPECIES: RusA family crossover junction endodeoxyribonuclease [Acinetobacter]|uniref:RusA family crossover junction endodeoxyribonuclease n=1 Tax=Acinetobacter TaxID=469 RepID=UPI0004272718|nr:MULTISPECIES: RusA family crossover junction endodeoxyribonuclease [Acinetobacter]AIL79056.1 endonuclease [Acinetobacter baumannii]ATD20134.1 RusA family crossover junction endodeoxyribonuclease [Acinetobacter baumannii]AVO89855.1 RusA family crossover junction endodeoxyribonuclease [Acinetobacter baumannii]AXG83897.1 RusA family crossover junction endodeoxyribonuclease [Acinetobacter baumannii]EHZ6829841.1 RusA family crossover junction endodeoxyribonuclease [Acinetobacter baumannii]
MRISEKEFESIQNKRNNAQKGTLQRDKGKSDAYVPLKAKIADTSEIRAFYEDGLKVILDCEIKTAPPSVNHYWVASGKRRFLSNKARDFHDLVRQVVPAHKSTARLKLEVTFHFPTRQCRDIDNYLKATIDSLVKCGLCVDDEQFDELLVKRGNVIKGGLIKLKVSEV